MIIQLVALAGMVFGLWSMTSLGGKAQWGWVASIISCSAWLIVNISLGVWAGVAYSIAGLYLSIRNWRKWHAESQAAVLRDAEGL